MRIVGKISLGLSQVSIYWIYSWENDETIQLLVNDVILLIWDATQNIYIYISMKQTIINGICMGIFMGISYICMGISMGIYHGLNWIDMENQWVSHSETGWRICKDSLERLRHMLFAYIYVHRHVSVNFLWARKRQHAVVERVPLELGCVVLLNILLVNIQWYPLVN